MNPISHLYEIQWASYVVAAIACWLLCAEYINIVRIRKPPYPWSSYSVSFILFALACDRLLKISEVQATYSSWQLASQFAVNGLVVLAALMIPIVRRATYKRPRFKQLQEIHEELKYSQALFRTYLDQAPVLAYIKDKEERITHINSGFTRLFGGSSAGIIGTTDLWGEPAANRTRDQQILAGGGEKEVTATLQLDDGECTMIDIRFPLTGPYNEQLLGGIAVDITNQLKRKNRIEVMASIVDLSPDAIYSQDLLGRILTWNPAAEAMFGYTSEEMTGQSVKAIMADDTEGELQKMALQFGQDPDSPQHFESVRVSKEGRHSTVLVAAAYVPGVEPTIAVITRDITVQKEVEVRINKLNQELEEKVHELSRINISLQKARDEALEAAGTKSAFVANMSHELRTPLSGILGMTEILAGQTLDEDSHKLVAMLQQSAQELLHVIEDILDLAKLEAGKTYVEDEVFSIQELVHDCEIQFAPTLKAKHLKWQASIDSLVPDLICSDRSILKRILSNLIANAITFTASGCVSLAVAIEHRDDSRLVLKFLVSDTGVGIAEELLPFLFTPFAKVSKTPDGLIGKGLGLVLCKKLTDLLRGQMGCSSNRNKGSIFWFTASVSQGEAAKTSLETKVQATAITPAELAQCVALSVDDSPMVSRLTMRQLGIIGMQAISAFTGSEAIEKAGKEGFDVILMDMHLPDMTGYTAAQEIRKQEESLGKRPSIIIALTGCTADELCEQPGATVMDDFLEKPVSIESLRASLLRALSQRESKTH